MHLLLKFSAVIDAINEKIARGIAQLDRGEGVSGEVAKARLQQRKTDWLRDKGA